MIIDAAPSEQVQTLVRWREQLGLSQLQVAVTIGVDAPKYSKWERGLARITDLQVVAVVNLLVERMTALQTVIPQGQGELQQIREACGA